MLELGIDASGTIVASNDNWKDTQESEIRPHHDLRLARDNRESAIVQTLTSERHTPPEVVRGKGGTVGIALVEVYKIN